MCNKHYVLLKMKMVTILKCMNQKLKKEIAAYRCFQMLKKALKQQYEIKQNILKRGYEPQAGFENLVFTTRDNHPLHARGVRLALEQAVGRIRKKYPTLQFDDVYPHALRHTFATRCIENGIAAKSLQIILGHSTIGITVNLYCHVMPETINMQKLENMQIAFTS